MTTTLIGYARCSTDKQARRNLHAAKRCFRKMLKHGPLLSPDRIGTDGAGTYPGHRGGSEGGPAGAIPSTT